jgi:hypothetical protein
MRLESINSIIYKSQLVANWAGYKKYLVIALGLNKYCSLINYKLFDRLKHYINTVEQSANKLYIFSIRQFLFPTITRY